MKFILFITIVILVAKLSDAQDRQSRLYNGEEANEGQFPYMGYLLYEKFLRCGVSIIHKRWLLTAGHCYLELYSRPRVTLGTTKLYFTTDGEGQTYNVEKFYVHENFTVIPAEQNNGLEYVADDIGVIRVDRDIVFNDKVKRIELSRDNDPNYNDKNVIISGWGKARFNSRSSKKLRYIDVPIENDNQCLKTWTYITEKYLCTSTASKGVCYGDSGSPVVLNGVQVGVTCTADEFCESLKPDMHTRVSKYISWIENKLSLYGDKL